MPLLTDRAPVTADPDASGVTFGMRDGARLVLCRISGEALRDAFGSQEDATDMARTFASYRHRIENVASRKYDRRQVVRGVVRLTIEDFG